MLYIGGVDAMKVKVLFEAVHKIQAEVNTALSKLPGRLVKTDVIALPSPDPSQYQDEVVVFLWYEETDREG